MCVAVGSAIVPCCTDGLSLRLDKDTWAVSTESFAVPKYSARRLPVRPFGADY